jgi:hypothetical protein
VLIDLTAADLFHADLTGASLRGAVARNAVFYTAVARGTVFEGAHLEDADFRDAELGNARFTGAWIERARFDRAHHVPPNVARLLEPEGASSRGRGDAGPAHSTGCPYYTPLVTSRGRSGRVHHIVVDAHDLPELARFWTQALGWKVLSEREREIVIGTDENAPVRMCFMPVTEAKRH